MVLVHMLSNEEGVIRYAYRPETNGEPYYLDGVRDENFFAKHGVLRYDKNNDSAEVEVLAEKDITSTFYRTPVFCMIRKDIDNLPQERLLVWY